MQEIQRIFREMIIFAEKTNTCVNIYVLTGIFVKRYTL